MDLSDHRLVHVEQGHAFGLGALEAPGIIFERLAATLVVLPRHGRRFILAQVVAGTEVDAGATQDDAMHAGVVVGLPERLLDFLLHLHADGIALFGPVQRDAGAAVGHFVKDGLVGWCCAHGVLAVGTVSNSIKMLQGARPIRRTGRPSSQARMSSTICS